MTILIIDDNEDLLNLLKETFESRYKVLTCSTGRSGLFSLIHNKPDVILLDIMMQGLNGFDLLKLLRNDPYTKETPIFIISALVEESVIEKTRKYGANGYIKKPFQLSRLKEFVDDVLENNIKLSEFHVI